MRERKSQRARTIGAISYERRNTTYPYYTMKTLIDLRANQEMDTSMNLQKKKNLITFLQHCKIKS